MNNNHILSFSMSISIEMIEEPLTEAWEIKTFENKPKFQSEFAMKINPYTILGDIRDDFEKYFIEINHGSKSLLKNCFYNKQAISFIIGDIDKFIPQKKDKLLNTPEYRKYISSINSMMTNANYINEICSESIPPLKSLNISSALIPDDCYKLIEDYQINLLNIEHNLHYIKYQYHQLQEAFSTLQYRLHTKSSVILANNPQQKALPTTIQYRLDNKSIVAIATNPKTEVESKINILLKSNLPNIIYMTNIKEITNIPSSINKVFIEINNILLGYNKVIKCDDELRQMIDFCEHTIQDLETITFTSINLIESYINKINKNESININGIKCNEKLKSINTIAQGLLNNIRYYVYDSRLVARHQMSTRNLAKMCREYKNICETYLILYEETEGIWKDYENILQQSSIKLTKIESYFIEELMDYIDITIPGLSTPLELKNIARSTSTLDNYISLIDSAESSLSLEKISLSSSEESALSCANTLKDSPNLYQFYI